MFAYLLLGVLELLNFPKEDRDKEILQWHSIPLQTEATLADLLTALMLPYLRALLGIRQERALLIERASNTIKTFINECNVSQTQVSAAD